MLKKGWLSRLKEGLQKSSEKLTQNIAQVFTHTTLNEAGLEALEDILIQADIGTDVAARIVEKIKKTSFEKEFSREDVLETIAAEIENILRPYAYPLEISKNHPHVILMVGVNGAGKTTTTAKLASHFQKQGHSVAVVAGDTFRAAAVEQLQVWATRLNIPVMSRQMGADPAGLAYDSYEEAVKMGYQVLLIDTAGRLHTNEDLMSQLEKISRVLKKISPTLPQSCLLVLDAMIGQNTYAQVEFFQKYLPVTGLILTKLDGTARGGVVAGVAEKFKIPIHAIGVGEEAEDLHPFHPKDFARSLVGLKDPVSP
jgi:fused signal recognition particle receptor